MGAIVQTGQRLVVSLHHLAVADPLEHKFEGEDTFIVNLKSIFVKLKLDGTISGCGGLAQGLPLR